MINGISLGFQSTYTREPKYPLIKEYSLNHNMKPCII